MQYPGGAWPSPSLKKKHPETRPFWAITVGNVATRLEVQRKSKAIKTIASMYGVYLPTCTIKINHSCRYIYQSHGWYGKAFVG